MRSRSITVEKHLMANLIAQITVLLTSTVIMYTQPLQGSSDDIGEIMRLCCQMFYNINVIGLFITSNPLVQPGSERKNKLLSNYL